ncbi:hypothetical protein Tco_0097863 [Tanacetum coccineum]
MYGSIAQWDQVHTLKDVVPAPTTVGQPPHKDPQTGYFKIVPQSGRKYSDAIGTYMSVLVVKKCIVYVCVLLMQLVLSIENKGKRLEVFIKEKGKEYKVDEDVPDIKKGRSTSTSKNSSLLETQSHENNTQSVDMQFDEITVQDDVDKKPNESKEIQCDKDKQLENDVDVEPRNNGIELVNDLTQILSPKVDISDMQIGLPGVALNDDGQTATATKMMDKFLKVTLQKALSKNEKKVDEFIWRANLQVQLGIFKSLFLNVEVATGIIDIWSLVLNHEEKYREKNSGGGNIYCCSGMLSEHLIESGADLITRRSIFESNITVVLAQSPYESFHDVDLVFFPMITTKRSHHFYLICFNMKTAEIDIIDNLDNDVDDISVRYGELPIYLICK